MGGKFMYLLVLLVVMICESSNAGEVHKVGESSGWTNLNQSPSYYKSWTASKNFQVGDTILFEYNKQFHDVVRVTHKNFNACNASAPYATWATGNDSFSIKRPGHYYFICSFPDHCLAGQKIDIRVLSQDKNSTVPTPPSGPSMTPSQPPKKSPPSVASGPSTISASPSHPPKTLNSYLKLCLCVLAIGFAAIGF